MAEISFGKLHEAVFCERPNRFLLQCQLLPSGEEVAVHLPDPGRLKELLIPGTKVWVRYTPKPSRKTKWSAVLVEVPESGNLVSLQSTLANDLIKLALQNDGITELAKWEYVRAEYPLSSSRWDFLLQDGAGREMLLEVKSVTLVEDRIAMFPDAVTARGKKHVLELAKLQSQGEFETAIMFVVQREDADCFRAASHIDPAFSAALQEAQAAGVSIIVRRCVVTHEGIRLGDSIPIQLDGGGYRKQNSEE